MANGIALVDQGARGVHPGTRTRRCPQVAGVVGLEARLEAGRTIDEPVGEADADQPADDQVGQGVCGTQQHRCPGKHGHALPAAWKDACRAHHGSPGCCSRPQERRPERHGQCG